MGYSGRLYDRIRDLKEGDSMEIEYYLALAIAGDGALIPFLPDTATGSPRTIAMAVFAVLTAITLVVHKHNGGA